MERIRAWWQGRSGVERLVIGAGVPVAIVAAALARRRTPPAAEDAGDDLDSEGGETGGGQLGQNIIDGSMIGGAGDLASFADAFQRELTDLGEQVEDVEASSQEAAAEATKTAQAANLRRLIADSVRAVATSKAEIARLQGMIRDGQKGGALNRQPAKVLDAWRNKLAQERTKLANRTAQLQRRREQLAEL